MTTIDIELMDATLNAPTGLAGLAADMADLAQRDGFTRNVDGYDLFIGLKQPRNDSRAGLRHG